MTTSMPRPRLMIGFFAVACVFGNLAVRGPSRFDKQNNAWDPILAMQADPYFLCYFATPVVLAVIIGRVLDANVLERQIRHGSRARSFRSVVLAAQPVIALFLGLWALAGVTSAVGLPLSHSWSPASLDPSTATDVLGTLAALAPVPVFAWVGQLALTTLFFTVLTAVLGTVQLITGSRKAVIAVAVACWLCLIFSWTLGGSLHKGLAVANYALLGSFPDVSVLQKFGTPVLVGAACLGLLVLRDRRRRAVRPTAFSFVVAAYLFVVVLGATVLYSSHSGEMVGASDSLYVLFYGRDAGPSNSWLLVTYHGLVFFGFVMLWLLRAEKRLPLLPYLIVRRRSTLAFLLRTFRPYVAAAAALLAGLIVLTFVLTAVAPPTGTVSLSGSALRTYYQLIVNGLAQLVLYWCIALVVAWWRESALTAFVVLAALFVATYLPSSTSLLPLGLNSLGLSSSWTSSVSASLLLLAFILISCGILAVITRRRPIPSWRNSE